MDGILKSLQKLTDEEFQTVLTMAFDQPRPYEIKKALKTRISKRLPVYAREAGRPGASAGCDPAERPGIPASTSDLEPSKSAFKVPFIYRSDLVPDAGVVFFDVEKLSLKKDDPKAPHVQVASSVAIVNDNRNLILWSFVKWENICQTFPTLTGITKQKLEIGFPMERVTPFIELAFDGNLVVGWDMDNDLTSVFVNGVRTDDLADYFLDENGLKMKLNDVYVHFFEKKVQCGIHSAIQDARATRDLYFKKLELMKMYPKSKTCPIKIQRLPKEPFKYDPQDVCKCPKKIKNKSKQHVFFLPK